MKRSIVYYGDSRLRQKCEEVTEITDEIREIAEDLLEGVKVYDGVGLAAPQIGELKRMYVVCLIKEVVDGKPVYGEPELFINPKLSEPSAVQESYPQGCLSIPGVYADVVRPDGITVEWMDLEGQWHKAQIQGYNATVVMHEHDHINGVLFIDRLSSPERKKLDPLLRKVKKKYQKK